MGCTSGGGPIQGCGKRESVSHLTAVLHDVEGTEVSAGRTSWILQWCMGCTEGREGRTPPGGNKVGAASDAGTAAERHGKTYDVPRSSAPMGYIVHYAMCECIVTNEPP